jgi:hypothetical protein
VLQAFFIAIGFGWLTALFWRAWRLLTAPA